MFLHCQCLRLSMLIFVHVNSSDPSLNLLQHQIAGIKEMWSKAFPKVAFATFSLANTASGI